MAMYNCNKNGNSSFGAKIIIFLVVIAIFYLIGAVSEANEPKCMKSGCDNKQATNSSYCYIHKPYTSSYSYSNGSSSYSNKTTESSSETKDSYSSENKSYTSSDSSYSDGTKNHTSSVTSGNYNSYDDGYDVIYMDGDYDYDRYDSDSDYADGVDDAMDEAGEDW